MKKVREKEDRSTHKLEREDNEGKSIKCWERSGKF